MYKPKSPGYIRSRRKALSLSCFVITGCFRKIAADYGIVIFHTWFIVLASYSYF